MPLLVAKAKPFASAAYSVAVVALAGLGAGSAAAEVDRVQTAAPLAVTAQLTAQVSTQVNAQTPEHATQVAAQAAADAALAQAQALATANPGAVWLNSLTTVLQASAGRARRELSFRGDIAADFPLGELDQGAQKISAHLRFGKGAGLGASEAFASALNASSFELDGDRTRGILAELVYQREWRINEFAAQVRGFDKDKLTLQVGKMDFFAYFDQNEVASDESRQFLNSVFVHNPMLDAGGDVAADRFGFAPGLRLGWSHDDADAASWGLSLGIFSAGAATDLEGPIHRLLSGPLLVAQAEVAPLTVNGQGRGNYRVYAWRNGGTQRPDGTQQQHAGLGLSIDQQVRPGWVVFWRWGRRTSGEGAFASALTVGAQWAGGAWGRQEDALGLAVGTLRAQGDSPLGSERVAELYYRFKAAQRLDLSPDWQLIHRPGGRADAPVQRVLSLRANLVF